MTDIYTDNAQKTYWKRCSSCKKEIAFEAPYQTCSVTTCNSGKTALFFCSVPCWDSHLGVANHRSSEACESYAPSRQEYLNELANASETPTPEVTPQRRIIRETPAAQSRSSSDLPKTAVLVVVSKVKTLIREQSEMNTSQCAVDALTEIVVRESLKAIENARAAGRKTVMGRDF